MEGKQWLRIIQAEQQCSEQCFFGMVIYFGYSTAFQNTEELKYQITQEVNASRSIISNDRWKSVIANSEATLNWLVHDYKLIDYLNTILIPDTKNQPEVLTLLLKNLPLLITLWPKTYPSYFISPFSGGT